MFRNDRERIAELGSTRSANQLTSYAKVRAPEKAFEQILQFGRRAGSNEEEKWPASNTYTN
jgi:hypothetical protein